MAAARLAALQWTLFRQATQPGPQGDGWANQQIWMAHAAVTRADTHRFNELFSRGGIGQAGVDGKAVCGLDRRLGDEAGSSAPTISTVAPLTLKASGTDFSYALTLEADRPVVLQGDGGYSRKSERGQASYYYSQPFYRARGTLTIDDKPVDVSGQAWMDREWSSQPLDADQTGWDWLSLHLASGDKLMLYRLRQKDGQNYPFGNWISADGDDADDRGRRYPDDPESDGRGRGPQAAGGMADRDPRRGRSRSPASRSIRRLDGDRAFPIGKDRSALPARMTALAISS